MKKRDLRLQSGRLLRLKPLPTLSPEEHREAAALIDSLVNGIRDSGPGQDLDVTALTTLIRHLRKIGDPSSAEQLSVFNAEYYEEKGNATEAVTMFNLAALTCFDQNICGQAAGYFDHGLRLIPIGDPRYQELALLVNYATMLTELHRYDEAESIYQKTLEMARGASTDRLLEHAGMTPEQTVGLIHNNRGWVLIRKSRSRENDRLLVQQAMERLNEAMAGTLLPRTRLMAQGNLAEAFIMLGYTRKALDLLDSSIEDCSRLDLRSLLPEFFRRRALLCAQERDIEGFVRWSEETMRTSLTQINPRQEKRIVEVFQDTLMDLLSDEADKLAVLEGQGAPVLELLLTLLRSKDTYTGGDHSKRVARLSGRMAALMFGGDAASKLQRVRKVFLSGLLHDIGKLVIPWSLLNKIGPLTARDMKQLQEHASVGKQLLSTFGLTELGDMVGEHHERPDGTGYPLGITELTEEGALVGVADAYEAMTSSARIYRMPKTREEALQEVQDAAGRQFDSSAVTALLKAV
jgi:HD-GYP domain-containing protein (c-di-GMP phosphodiesterase class II)